MKYSCLFAALVAAEVYAAGPCNTKLTNAYNQCIDFITALKAPLDTPAVFHINGAHESLCYGDWTGCVDLQKFALTPDGDCTVNATSDWTPNLRDFITPCENPMPQRIFDKQMCTPNNLILSEYYGKIFVDVVRNNNNEHFTYNSTSKNLVSKTNGQCLEGVPDATGTGGSVKTAPCDYKNSLQTWTFGNNRIITWIPYVMNYCLKADRSKPGSQVTLEQCDCCVADSPVFSNQFVSECTNFVHIVSTRAKRISEYYQGLYFDQIRDNYNELFVWDTKNKMFKSASAQQCLDAYLDSDGRYKIHTYSCDVNNPNQKWNVRTDTKQIEHATHKGQCIDGDPTYPDHHLQMWACVPNNPNQQWEVVPFGQNTVEG